MIDVVIDRSKWRCGGDGIEQRGEGYTQLLNSDGFMCCLGFASLAVGCSRRSIKGIGCVDSVARQVKAAIPKLVRAGLVESSSDGGLYDSTHTLAAMGANDNESLSTRDRESKVRAALKQIGMKVKFVGKYHKPPNERQTHLLTSKPSVKQKPKKKPLSYTGGGG